jgi:hypothetical protein
VEVSKGNTGDLSTLASQITKLKQRFGLTHVAIVRDRGMLTRARIRDDLRPPRLDWITALRGPAIAALISQGAIQPALFDEADTLSRHRISTRVPRQEPYPTPSRGISARRRPESAGSRPPSRRSAGAPCRFSLPKDLTTHPERPELEDLRAQLQPSSDSMSRS